MLRKLMFDARLLLQEHEINQVRVDLGENPANMIWLWGQGTTPVLLKFNSKYKVAGALVADSEFAKGVGRLSGLTVLDVPLHKGDPEAYYEKKGRLVMDALQV